MLQTSHVLIFFPMVHKMWHEEILFSLCNLILEQCQKILECGVNIFNVGILVGNSISVIFGLEQCQTKSWITLILMMLGPDNIFFFSSGFINSMIKLNICHCLGKNYTLNEHHWLRFCFNPLLLFPQWSWAYQILLNQKSKSPGHEDTENLCTHLVIRRYC